MLPWVVSAIYANPAGHESRAVHQPQNRQDARARSACPCAGPRRRGAIFAALAQQQPDALLVAMSRIFRIFGLAERHPAGSRGDGTSHLLILQQLDLQISLGRPCSAGDVA
jgi:hypothetical protein